jgi:capsid protein
LGAAGRRAHTTFSPRLTHEADDLPELGGDWRPILEGRLALAPVLEKFTDAWPAVAAKARELMAARTPLQFIGDVWHTTGRLLNRATRRARARGFDGAGWSRFPAEARMGRAPTEMAMSRARLVQRSGYYAENSQRAHAGINAKVTLGWGAGAVIAHPNAAQFEEWAQTCDADGVLTFDSMVALAIREWLVGGEALFVFVGDKIRLLPGSQLDDSSSDLGNGVTVENGIEKDASGRRTAYMILPTLPSSQFETYGPPVRVLAEDVVHLYRQLRAGQNRGLPALTPVLLTLAGVDSVVDALREGVRVSALNSVYFSNKDATGGLPFEGDQSGDTVSLAPEPGTARVLPGNWDVHAFTPMQSQQAVEFLSSEVNGIAAALDVCPFMISGDFSRSSYSNLRASLLTMKAATEAWQWQILVPALNAVFKRWALMESLRGNEIDDSLPTWRFPQFPDADPIKAMQATREAMAAKIMSRREAIEARGEDPDAVTAEIEGDPFPEAYTTGAVAAPSEQVTEDSDAE